MIQTTICDCFKEHQGRWRSGVALMCLKTFPNCWPTSYRSHESILLPCIFGCTGCKDDLKHYIVCDPLWMAVCTATKREEAWFQVAGSLRIGFPNPNATSLLFAIIFKVYHALRNDLFLIISQSVEDGDFSDMLARTRFLTLTFADDYSV